jgi:hypothetical protein
LVFLEGFRFASKVVQNMTTTLALYVQKVGDVNGASFSARAVVLSDPGQLCKGMGVVLIFSV